MNQSEPRYTSLRDYLAVLRKQWLVILLIAAVGTAIALYVSLRADAVYEATASVSFQDQSEQLSVLGGSVNPRTPTDQTPQAQAEAIEQPVVVREVARALDGDLEAGQVAAAVETSIDPETFLVSITASSDDPEQAALIANTYAEQAAQYTNQRAEEEFEDALDEVEGQLDDLGNGITPTDQSQRNALVEQQSRLEFLRDNAEAAELVRDAQEPAGAVSPKPIRNTALGLLLGLALGIMVAFLRDSLDRRLRGSYQVQLETGIPVAGHIREEAMGKVIRRGADFDTYSEDLEAMRILRQNLAFLSVDDPLRVILVTSPLPQEGKSTVASSLAFASAAAGMTTLLIDCDLRRPSLADRLEVAPAPGLADYLAGQAKPEEVLRTVAGAAGAPQHTAEANGGDASARPASSEAPLVCIPAGTISPQPAELLNSARFRDFLGEVASVYDQVVLDTSPLLPVVDTLELLPHVSGALLCVRSGRTTREQALAAKEVLARVPDKPIGIVVTGMKRRDSDGYSGYSYGYSPSPERERQPSKASG